jgi:hypothetical protein
MERKEPPHNHTTIPVYYAKNLPLISRPAGSRRRKANMKKNVRKIPRAVRNKLQRIAELDIVVGCACKFSAAEIRDGALSHLGIRLAPAGLQYPERIVPPADQGKYSRRNVDGWEQPRYDLPLETGYHAAEAPNWGDSYYGTHTVSLPHKVRPKDFHPPRELELVLHCANPDPEQDAFVLAARVDEVLAQSALDFEDRLLEDLNLLQENLGACGVQPADTSLADYARTLHLAWDILPPGSRDEALQRLFRGRRPTQQQQDTAASRYDFFESLNPRQIIVGTSGFRRYFGALLEDNLVVFENIQYGNAIYVMYENWQELSQRSRIELLSGRLGDRFDRVTHREGWQAEVRLLVQARRQKGRP